MKAPGFWTYGTTSFASTALSPLSCLYNIISTKRANKPARYTAKIPVICVGNLIMGGAGKTPSAIAVAQTLIAQGRKPVFLSRGYGGTVTGPELVNNQRADQVGDEPLLLKQTAPVCISQDRIAGAKFCEENGFDVIIMDDGYQNPYLHKDISILVIDGGYGHGNEKVFPAGPLREDLTNGLKRAQALLIIGEDETGSLNRLQQMSGHLPIMKAKIKPDPQPELNGQTVVAFAGIARPEKFYQTARELGCEIAATVDFKDHHAFEEKDLTHLQNLSNQHNAKLVTTEKDWVRLPDPMKKQVDFVKISLAFEDEDVLNAVLSSAFVK